MNTVHFVQIWFYMAKGVIIVTDSVLLLLQWPLRLRPCTVRSRSLWKGLFCLCSPPQWIWSEAVKLWLKCRPIKRPNILFSLILNGLKVTRMGLRCPRVHLIFHSGSGRRQHHLNCITAQKPEPYFDWFNDYWDIIPFRKCYISIISWDHGKKKMDIATVTTPRISAVAVLAFWYPVQWEGGGVDY